MKRFLMASFVFVVALQGACLAHQPQLLGSEIFIRVREPEVSKAYYGELRGAPAVFIINSEEPFRLYANVLVPDIKGISKEVSAKILCDGRVIAKLDAASSKWEPFYEEFGGDNYFKGPEYSQKVKPGDYEIVVYNSTNTGKYVLAIGDVEAFPPLEMIKTLMAMPLLKMYFEKSPFMAFSNKVGEFLFPVVLLIVILAVVAVITIKRSSRR